MECRILFMEFEIAFMEYEIICIVCDIVIMDYEIVFIECNILFMKCENFSSSVRSTWYSYQLIFLSVWLLYGHIFNSMVSIPTDVSIYGLHMYSCLHSISPYILMCQYLLSLSTHISMSGLHILLKIPYPAYECTNVSLSCFNVWFPYILTSQCMISICTNVSVSKLYMD